MNKELKIIRGCKKGDKSYQYELVRCYSEMLFTVCRRYTIDDASAKDVLQESLLLIFNKIHLYKPIGSFEAWMRKITVRCALDWLNRKSNKRNAYALELEESLVAEEPEILVKLEVEQLITLIRTLPEGYRNVLNLYSIEGYSHKEIAEVLGISESSSRSQLTRARRYLIKRMNELQKIQIRY